MSGTYPDSPGPAEMTLESVQPVTNSISSSGRRQGRITEGHIWEINLKYGLMLRSEMAPIYAFIGSQRADSFDIVLPQYNTPLGSPSGVIVAGAGSRGSGTISTSGWSGNLKAGSVIKFVSHSKVYMLSEDAAANSTLKFFPDLVEDVSSGGPIAYSGVPFKVFMSSDIVRWKTTSPNLANYELNMTEAIDG